MFTFPALPALLFLALARLAAAVAAHTPYRFESGDDGTPEPISVPNAPARAFAPAVWESFFRGRGDAWPDPSPLLRDGCSPFHAWRRRCGRGCSG
ncbi:MAG: hypothetical protein WBC44_14135 [Planctomycetaceae bacterium]